MCGEIEILFKMYGFIVDGGFSPIQFKYIAQILMDSGGYVMFCSFCLVLWEVIITVIYGNCYFLYSFSLYLLYDCPVYRLWEGQLFGLFTFLLLDFIILMEILFYLC